MKEKYYIVLIEFFSKEEGVYYMDKSDIKFAFYANGKAYSYLGELIDSPENPSIFKIGQISIKTFETPFPGQLFILNGFLQYFKEIIN